ncbi:hypothetical protein F511_41300 [Dorcoceras hygrometricum]|uniref:Uncharacterized protein n=1 Tax=Dorcoceras hygrometricum TaxID=472368 RepID=A0A2Z7BLD3_9LAMI|nr:hypothetical protein F511_41300 [Dorcoceras hygrometricum]
MKISADTFLEEFSSWLVFLLKMMIRQRLTFELVGTTAVELVGTTAFGLIQQKRSLVVSADGYSDSNQQVLYLLSSSCILKIAKRCRLNKLTRHRFIAKGISRWKNAYAFQQMNSSKRFSSRSFQRRRI